MKIALSFIAILLFIVTSNAQSKTISKDEYDNVFDFAVSRTNVEYPFIFKVITKFIEKGKTVRTVTEVRENQLSDFERVKITDIANGRETNKYQTKVGYDSIFCSSDGISWKTSKYECSGSVMVYGRREYGSTEYSVTEETVKGKKVKVYREYSIFPPLISGKKKAFSEKVSTIDSRGFFITIVDTEGTLDPKTITLTREQSWITNAKFKPVIAPKKLID